MLQGVLEAFHWVQRELQMGEAVWLTAAAVANIYLRFLPPPHRPQHVLSPRTSLLLTQHIGLLFCGAQPI